MKTTGEQNPNGDRTTTGEVAHRATVANLRPGITKAGKLPRITTARKHIRLTNLRRKDRRSSNAQGKEGECANELSIRSVS